MNERGDFLRERVITSKLFHGSGQKVIKAATLHLSLKVTVNKGYNGCREMPCKTTIYCWGACACALRMWMSVFFHEALSDYALCVLTVHTQAAAGTLMETWSLTPQTLSTDVRTCIS